MAHLIGNSVDKKSEMANNTKFVGKPKICIE